MKIRNQIIIVLCTFVLASFVAPAHSFGDAKSDKAQLRERSKQRAPAIRQHKSAGKIGETSDGYIEAVDPNSMSDAALKQLVDDENIDRRTLYTMIAKEQHTTADVVAKNAAQINFRDAKAGDYLKTGGVWKRK